MWNARTRLCCAQQKYVRVSVLGRIHFFTFFFLFFSFFSKGIQIIGNTKYIKKYSKNYNKIS